MLRLPGIGPNQPDPAICARDGPNRSRTGRITRFSFNPARNDADLHRIRTSRAGLRNGPTPRLAQVNEINRPSILIVEDEPMIAAAVHQRLRGEGFETSIAASGESALEAAEAVRFDLVVLDLGLPGIDGIEVCRRLQAGRRTPVVMLTARDDETDMLIGLGVGADDYITKPFSPRELVARIRAVLRRAADRPTDAADAWWFHGLHVDVATRRVFRGGDEIHLTPTEFDLLTALASARGTVLDRRRLLEDVWGYTDGSGHRTVDSHIRAVRRKVGDDVIRTVHGVGYSIDGVADTPPEPS